MKRLHHQLGFTMIELLIVITILGILAVAVLSAINPIEQINRGRDTGRQSDAEQLLSAIDRYNAFQGYYPWQIDANDPNIAIMDANGLPVPVTETTPFVGGVEEEEENIVLNGGGMFSWLVSDVFAQEDPPSTVCPILTRLSTGIEGVANCAGAQELKESFVRRVASGAGRRLYVYNNGLAGASTYVCFVPQSGAFDTQALERCADPAEPPEGEYSYGVGLPVDVGEEAANFICNPTETFEGLKDVPGAMVCLP